jgi:hypothetical protein
LVQRNVSHSAVLNPEKGASQALNTF